MDYYIGQEISALQLEQLLSIYEQDSITYNKYKVVIDIFTNFINTWRKNIHFIHIAYDKDSSIVDFRLYMTPNTSEDVKRIIHIALSGLLLFIGLQPAIKDQILLSSIGFANYPDTISILNGLFHHGFYNNLPILMITQ